MKVKRQERNRSRMTSMDESLSDQQHEALTDKAVERYSNKTGYFMQRQQGKVVHRLALSELEQGLEYRHQAVRMALETRLQAMEEHCNHVLVTGKTQYRQERNSFFMDEMVKLQSRMDELADQFNESVDKRLERAQNYSSDYLKARQQERLEKSIDDFMETLDLLIDDFKAIFQSKINHQSL